MSRFFNSSDENGGAKLVALNATLRQMAYLGLARVFGQTRPPVACDAATARLLHQILHLHDSAAGQTAARRRFEQIFLINDAPTLTAAQLALVEAAQPKTRLARLIARLRAWIHKKRHRPAPLASDAAHFTEIWSAAAFGTYAFKAHVARVLHSDLEDRVLLWPADPTPAHLSPITCWWLASQIDARDITGLPPRRTASLLAAVTAHAETLAQHEGWAGFWDQYLHQRAAQHSLTTPNPMGHLPLLSQGAQALTSEPESDCPQALPNWRATAPAYAPALFGGGF